jgi:hypothetical protein
MNYLGHNEFGLNHKPWNDPINHQDLNNIDYWLEQWCLFYQNILNKYQFHNKCHFVIYEKLTNANYIKKLLEPIRSDLYLPNEFDRHPGAQFYRYAFERWVVTGNPSINYLLDTETDHYGSYFFIEDIPTEKR